MTTQIWNTVVGLGAGKKSESDVNASLDRRKIEQQVTEFSQMFDEKSSERGHSKDKIDERKEKAIARFSGASIVGCNNNDYQIKRSEMFNRQYHLDHICTTEKNDFMKLSYPTASFDACYAIEATCHAPDKVGCYSQMFRVLKPGGYFAAYEWCITDKYDGKNEYHRTIKHLIEKGDSLPDLVLPEEVIDGLKKAGFEVVEHFDIAVTSLKTNPITWYSTLQGGWKPSTFKHTKWGRFVTQKAVDLLESIKIAPKGTGETHRILSTAADCLAKGGETGIFTPMYYFLARKPLNAK